MSADKSTAEFCPFRSEDGDTLAYLSYTLLFVCGHPFGLNQFIFWHLARTTDVSPWMEGAPSAC